MHDPLLYPNPETVDPERYLHRDASDVLNPDPRSFAFGYGRRCVGPPSVLRSWLLIDPGFDRVCPGQTLAEDMLFIAAANILEHFDVSDARSLDGSEPQWEGAIIWYVGSLSSAVALSM